MSRLTLRTAALNYLARREHTHDELFRKLSQKKFPEAEIRELLQSLSQEGLLNHSRFVENYIHFRSEKGYGPLRIRAELLTRGLSEEFIEEHLKIRDNAWRHNAYKVWQKRFKGTIPRDFKTRAQQTRFLYQRGFTEDQINDVLKDE